MRRLRCIVGVLAVLCRTPLQAQAPAGAIRGRIVDSATQQPLSAVTVAVGSRRATSRADGAYLLTRVPAGTDSLRASMLGYAPVTRAVTVAAGDTLVIDLALAPQTAGLSELVMVGYGQRRAGDITGAVSQVTAAEFNTGRIISPEQLIEGKVAGVQVVDDDEPGGGLAIRIRGATSIDLGSDPLYVVDGMPLGPGTGGGLSAGRDPLNFLNPDDIASITVLKGGDAASIYGMNAANGVVLITTKSGAGAQHGTVVEYSTTASTSNVVRNPQVLSAAQFTAAVAQVDPARSSMLGTANTNWLNLIERTGYGTEQNVSMTSTGDNTLYRLSLGYMNDQGIVQGSSTQRLSVGFNYDTHLFSDALGIKANIKGSRDYDQFQAGDVLGNAVGMAPTQPVYDPTNPTGYWDWPGTTAGASNPVASLNRSTNVGTTWRSVGNVQVDWAVPFIDHLKANANVGYDITAIDHSIFQPNDLRDQAVGLQGFLSYANNNQTNEVGELYLNYAAPLEFVPGAIDVTGGYSYTRSHSEAPYFQETGLSSNLLGINGVPSATTAQNSNYIVNYKLISFFGRADYNLNDRYLATVSLRRDRSSRFEPSNAWGTFPSIAVAWRVLQEPFMRSVTALSDLKLRASWARTGNQWVATFDTTSAVDPNIKWESTSSYGAGLDYGFLNQRLTGSVDWYTRKTTDLIFTVPVSAGTNFSNLVTTNIGSMQNQGVELSVSAAILQPHQGSLGYTANFTVAHNANKLLTINGANGITAINVGAIGGGTGNTIQVLQPGYAINSFLVCQQAYKNGKPLENTYVSGDSTVTGCTSNARPYHSPWPSLELGHTSNFTYGNFDFSFSLRASLGNYVYNNIAASNGSYLNVTGGNVTPGNMDVSVLKTGFVSQEYLSDYYVQDASFLRMDNITLGYSFTVAGRRWRLYAVVQNAFTITGYAGVDPAAVPNGIDNNLYPSSRIVTAGLNVRL